MKSLISILSILIILSTCHELVMGQAVQQREPDPNTGDLSMLRTGIMDGNRIATRFKNWGEIAEHPYSPSCEWPQGTGHEYQDGVALIVCVSTFDTTGKLIHPMETQYREFVDLNPEDPAELWGWAPLPGYISEGATSPAMSDDPKTWPVHWPDKPYSWDGYWNGWFGKGKTQAQLETYFVFDDDPLLTPAKRKALENRGGSGILKLGKQGDLLVGQRDIILGLHIPHYPSAH